MYANERIGPLAAREAKTRKGGLQAGAPMQPSAAGLQADLKACTEGVHVAGAGTHQLLHTL